MAKKRVHELAKERDMSPRDMLAKLQAAGIPVKAVASAVDEQLAKDALAGKKVTAPKANGSGANGQQAAQRPDAVRPFGSGRSEEHTSELQSRQYRVCRLLLEKKNTRSTAVSS